MGEGNHKKKNSDFYSRLSNVLKIQMSSFQFLFGFNCKKIGNIKWIMGTSRAHSKLIKDSKNVFFNLHIVNLGYIVFKIYHMMCFSK